MQISWFTVIAQVINFFILVWLLKKYLYKPVLKAIDEREKNIASKLEDAEAKETEANKEQQEFKQKNDEFDSKKKALMDKAVAETNDERKKLVEAAKNEAHDLHAKMEKELKDMQEKLNHEIVQKTQNEVFSIARKVLNDLASSGMEEQATINFIKHINDLKKKEKEQFIEAFKSDSNPILVQSAFELPSEQQTDIKSAVTEILGKETQFHFKTSPKLISGIELTSNGYKLAWSISEYLNSLQRNISDTMKEKSNAEPDIKEHARKKTK